MKYVALLLLFISAAACSSPTPTAIALPTSTPLPTPTPTFTPTPEPTATPTPVPTLIVVEQYVSAEDGLNLRTDPSLDGTLIETLAFATHLLAVDRPTAPDQSGYTWRRVQTDDGQSGWVASQYLTDTLPVLTADDLYTPFSIEGLRQRAYDIGPIEIAETLEDNAAFRRYAVAYPSDGLRVTAMMNVPKGPADARYPVIILNHGYVDPASFPTGSYIRAEADYLARRGYLTLSPDYRGHAGSEGSPEEAGPNVRGENTFRVSYAIDVLNLLSALPSLPQADPDRVGMWGHSMGGGITLKVLTVDRGAHIGAAVLYSAMSGDEAQNLRHIDRMWRRGIYDEVTLIFGTPEQQPGDYSRLSPLSYVADIGAPIEIHHGALDDQVPVAWSRDLNQRLIDAGKTVTYFEYDGASHALRGDQWVLFMQQVAEFYDQNVKGVNP